MRGKQRVDSRFRSSSVSENLTWGCVDHHTTHVLTCLCALWPWGLTTSPSGWVGGSVNMPRAQTSQHMHAIHRGDADQDAIAKSSCRQFCPQDAQAGPVAWFTHIHTHPMWTGPNLPCSLVPETPAEPLPMLTWAAVEESVGGCR